MGRHEIIENRQNIELGNGCPLLVDRLAIVSDRLDNTLFAQLRFKNLGDIPIAAVHIKLSCADQTAEYIYSDLNAKCGDYFGFDKQIPLPDKAEQIEVKCKHIDYKNTKDLPEK